MQFYIKTHRLARRLMGRQPRQGVEGVLKYLPLDYTMTEAVLQEVETYISRRQNTVAQFIVTRIIMNLCLAAERRPGSRVYRRLWEQDGLDVEGMRTGCMWRRCGRRLSR